MEYLVCFWLAVAKQCPDGILKGWTQDDIEDAAGWDGEPGKLFQAMLSNEERNGFLDRLEGGFTPHDWEENQPWVIGAPARSEAASKAARTRWASKTDAERMPDACGEQCGFDAPSPSPSPSPLPKKKKHSVFFLPSWVPEDAWEAFNEMREKKDKKGWTDRAKKLAINTLEKLREEGHDPEEILNRSVFHGWKGLFRPDEGKKVSNMPDWMADRKVY